ncbi:MAG: tetratricopeptide repeat protein [Candidatus Lokiarchaeota archaeon]|nr:tetratricopeptide repeat protein [Candidatus Lokiarchaeota archaeon]MBD3341764.1 tetratricopeptide repeat protein [Candidatus Lokiarchaeota archaeon]
MSVSKKIKEKLEKAIRFRKEHKYEAAIEIVENLFRDEPQSKEIKENLVETLIDYGGFLNDEQWDLEVERAEEMFRRASEIDPMNHRAWYNLGIAQFNLGKYDEALKNYNKALEIKPDYSYCYYNTGLLYELVLKDFQKALYYYDKATSYNENLTYAIQAKNDLRRKIDAIKKDKSEPTEPSISLSEEPKNHKLCNNCGTLNRPVAKFCDKCGKKI